MGASLLALAKYIYYKGVDDRAIHAKGAVVNSLLLPNNRERHNLFLANSRDTSIKPEMSSGYPAGRKAVFPPALHFSRKIIRGRNV